MSSRYTLPTYRVRLVRDRATLKASAPWQAADVLRRLTTDDSRECMHVLYLDGQNSIIGGELVAMGGVSGLCVTAADVYRGAVIIGAAGIVLGHNHPSGSREPSAADFGMTQAVKAAGEVLGIPLLDHVIVTRHNGHHSMLDNDQL